MLQAIPSRTALRVALRRAAHQIYDSPRVFSDPLAVTILGKKHADELLRTPTRTDRPFSTGLRAFLIARSRFAEDTLARAIATGTEQYVLLGAGLDTFAYRNPWPRLRVFEVDHPATQVWKRELLEESAIAIPRNLTYAPVDFEGESLADGLHAAGFDPAVPTFFAWLGVVPYLTLTAFRATISFVVTQPAGSGIVLDYGQPRSALPFFEKLAHDSLASRVAAAGEPFQLFFTAEEVAAELASFHTIEDIGREEINARYFASRDDSLQIKSSGGRLLSAWL